MNTTDLFIQVEGKQEGCSVIEHFKKSWKDNEKLHPKLKAINTSIRPTDATRRIKVVHATQGTILEFNGNHALRLDELAAQILELLN